MPSSHRAEPPPEERPGRAARRWAALLPVLFAVLAVALIAAGVIPLRSHHTGTGTRGARAGTGATALAPGAPATPTPSPSGPAPVPTAVVTSPVSGLITLHSPRNAWTYPGSCAGIDKYRDLSSGATVAVFDDQNQQVATTVLGGGVAVSPKACSFSFFLSAFALARPEYTVQIGSLTFTEPLAKLAKDKYAFSFDVML